MNIDVSAERSTASVPHIDSLPLAGTALFDLANTSGFIHYRRVSEAAWVQRSPLRSPSKWVLLPGLMIFGQRTNYLFQVLAAHFSGTSSWNANKAPSGFFASTTIAHPAV